LWVGTLGGGLFVRQNDHWKKFSVSDVLPNNFVRCFFEDRRGAMWIGTEGGLVRFYNGHWETITNANGLPSPFIWSLWEDHEGSLWIGMFGGGIARLKDPKLLTLTKKQGLADDHIWSVY